MQIYKQKGGTTELFGFVLRTLTVFKVLLWQYPLKMTLSLSSPSDHKAQKSSPPSC